MNKIKALVLFLLIFLLASCSGSKFNDTADAASLQPVTARLSIYFSGY